MRRFSFTIWQTPSVGLANDRRVIGVCIMVRRIVGKSLTLALACALGMTFVSSHVVAAPAAQPVAYHNDNEALAFYKPLSSRTGADCKKHTYIVLVHSTFKSAGDTHLIEAYGRPEIVPGSRTATSVKVTIGGKRRNRRIVLCYGVYRILNATPSGDRLSRVPHRFKLGHARGSTIVKIGPGQSVVYAIYARRKR